MYGIPYRTYLRGYDHCVPPPLSHNYLTTSILREFQYSGHRGEGRRRRSSPYA